MHVTRAVDIRSHLVLAKHTYLICNKIYVEKNTLISSSNIVDELLVGLSS